jgi:hypothetical protein
MDIEQLGSLGWREGLLAIIALLVLYIILLFVRMRRLQRDLERGMILADKAAPAAVAVGSLPAAEASVDASADAGVTPPDAPADQAPAMSADTASAKPDFAWNEPPPEIPGKALIDALQRDVYQLRGEIDDLRSEVLAARADFRRALAQAAEPVPAASPLYKDAMQLAVQGHDAPTIARHCAIARAEADLIVALARNRKDGIL